MTATAHLFVATCALAVLVFVLALLRRRQLRGKYALLWLLTVSALAPLAAWPDLLTRISDWVGIFYPPALFLLLAVGFLFLVVVHFSWELSRLEERTRVLAEEVTLMRLRVEQLEEGGRAPAAGSGRP
ncbi:MAG: hypothetical protein KatS3mg008_0210 [Acidimicrobiales bacterium]|nr:MAG: hypothetical protein KatS3mg008_0210 [Acidimicrobiales bacterium]